MDLDMCGFSHEILWLGQGCEQDKKLQPDQCVSCSWAEQYSVSPSGRDPSALYAPSISMIQWPSVITSSDACDMLHCLRSCGLQRERWQRQCQQHPWARTKPVGNALGTSLFMVAPTVSIGFLFESAVAPLGLFETFFHSPQHLLISILLCREESHQAPPANDGAQPRESMRTGCSKSDLFGIAKVQSY